MTEINNNSCNTQLNSNENKEIEEETSKTNSVELVEPISDEQKKIENQEIDYQKFFGKSIDFTIRDQKITIYYNGLASQSNASTLILSNGTAILSTFDIDDEYSEDIDEDFAPFTAHFLTKGYAFGRIPIGQSKREGKPSERDILLSRLIDRSIRPIVPPKFKKNSQLIVTLLSHPTGKSQTSDFTVDFLALIGSAAAIILSSMPIDGFPISTRIGEKDGEFIFSPYNHELQKSPLDLFITFTNEEIIMLECEAKEIEKEKLIKAIEFARKEKKAIEEFFSTLKKLGKEKVEIDSNDFNIKLIIRRKFFKEIQNLLLIANKTERNLAFKKLENKIVNEILNNDPSIKKNKILQDFNEVKKDLMKSKIFETGIRVDGRKYDEIRPLSMMIDIPFMQSSHGSALFARGDTRALVSTVLGTAYDEQIVDGYEIDKKERFILHYNFLPYAVGEASQLKSPNRREIGHAKLASKALKNLIPEKNLFPYTIRVSSEILSCDGSSSMATICGASMAMIDAGIPLSSCAAGIAIGVVVKSREKNEIIVLTDIVGDEDHLGDMDFKIAGTKKGITALQMDVKDFGIKDEAILSKIIESGFVGYNKVLDAMNDNLANHTHAVKHNAPSIFQMMIEKSQIRSVIGNRGETVRTICEMSGARVDVDPGTGIVSIFAHNKASVDKAKEIIEDLILQPEVGKIYQGAVEKVTDFGIFVKFLRDKARGLIHEKNCDGDRYEFYNLKKSLKNGDEIKIKVLFISSDGKIGLSMVEEDQEVIEKTCDSSSSSNSEPNESEKSSNKTEGTEKKESKNNDSCEKKDNQEVIEESPRNINNDEDILSILNKQQDEKFVEQNNIPSMIDKGEKQIKEKYKCTFF
jgi:polyribonucleotide nucleotidyltransferase